MQAFWLKACKLALFYSSKGILGCNSSYIFCTFKLNKHMYKYTDSNIAGDYLYLVLLYFYPVLTRAHTHAASSLFLLLRQVNALVNQ